MRVIHGVNDKRKNAQKPFGGNQQIFGWCHAHKFRQFFYLFLPIVVFLPSYNSLDSIETTGRERTSMQRKTPNPRKNPDSKEHEYSTASLIYFFSYFEIEGEWEQDGKESKQYC